MTAPSLPLLPARRRLVSARTPARLRGRRAEDGYVAVLVGLLTLTLVALSAFAVDVGHWYLVGQQAQRAADAAALAGVTDLPGDQTSAFALAQSYSKMNGFQNGVSSTTVTPTLDGGPTRLRVTVGRTVNNIFGPLLGIASTTVSRTAVADYTGPVPMGSPCNEFGNDPDSTSSTRGTACSGVTGQMWANVNGYSADKQNGDSIQSHDCNTSVAGKDGCSGSTNTDFNPNGYFYIISVKQPMASLTVQLFDPVFVDVGLTCGNSIFTGSTTAVNDYVNAADAAHRYVSGNTTTDGAKYCTGDNLYSGTQVMNTTFTLRSPSQTSWDPLSYPVVYSKTYPGWTASGSTLFKILNKATVATYRDDIAQSFRRWSTFYTITNPQVGDYLLQVSSNVGGVYNNADAGNRFAIRATASNLDAVSIAARQTMGIFSNQPGATTQFYLARVPSGSAGGTLNVTLYDVGDSSQSGTITIVPPSGGSFSGCTGSGVTTSISAGCAFTVTAGSPSAFNGRYEVVKVPIPLGYSCNDNDSAACWVKLTYTYGSGSAPTDVTTWSAKLEGDPIRLVE